MSGKLNMKSIIAIAAVTVLTAIAIIGTVVFLKDKGTSEATEIASENGVNGSGTETINVQENGIPIQLIMNITIILAKMSIIVTQIIMKIMKNLNKVLINKMQIHKLIVMQMVKIEIYRQIII